MNKQILTVLRFSVSGGYGFLEAPVGDVLVHAKMLPKNLGVLLPGWEVQVDYEKTPKGFRVTKVYRIIPKEIVVIDPDAGERE